MLEVGVALDLDLKIQILFSVQHQSRVYKIINIRIDGINDLKCHKIDEKHKNHVFDRHTQNTSSTLVADFIPLCIST